MKNNFSVHTFAYLFILFLPLLGAASTLIRLDDQILSVELAQTDFEHRYGLMNRSHLPEGTGMLFIYREPKILSFWMKNTKIPLDIGFFDAARRLIHIEHMEVPHGNDLPLFQSPTPSLYALEVPYGWFERHHISISTRLEWEKNPVCDMLSPK